MSKTKAPFFGEAILCNSTSHGESGKIDSKGLFTSFLAWSYPTSNRNWHLIFGLYDFPGGVVEIKVTITHPLALKENIIYDQAINLPKKRYQVGHLIDLDVNCEFEYEGYYQANISLRDFSITKSIPLKVVTQPWPEFTPNEIDYFLKTPSIPHKVRLVVVCSECSSSYIFEESALEESELSEGVYVFPSNGSFDCLKCGHKMNLRDIQGQMRKSLKASIPSNRRGG